MPRKKHSELAAGLFVVGALAVVLGVVLWLGVSGMLQRGGRTAVFYHPIAKGSLGVAEGSDVKIGDRQIGRIVEVIDDLPKGLCYYRVRLERDDVTIFSDANAVVVSQTVGPSKVVITSLGTSGVPADQKHPAALGGGLDQVMVRIAAMAEGLEQAVAELRRQFNPSVPQALLWKIHQVADKISLGAESLARAAADVRGQMDPNVPGSVVARVRRGADDIGAAAGAIARQADPNVAGSILARVNRAAGHVEAQTDPNVPGSLIASANDAVREIRGMVRDVRPPLRRAVEAAADTADNLERASGRDLPDILQKVAKVADNFAAVSQQARQIVETNRGNLDETLDNMSVASAELKSAVRQIRYRPWLLLYKPAKPELREHFLHESVRAFCTSAEQLDQAVGKLRTLQTLKDGDPARKERLAELDKRIEQLRSRLSEAGDALWEDLKKP